jgi:penicillin-binding protein 1A
MREDGTLDAGAQDEGSEAGLPPLPALVALDRPRRDIGFHFVDQVAREARSEAGIDRITDASYTVHSTIDPPLQRAVEESLQEGLSRYERDNGRAQFAAAEANLAGTILKIEADRKHPSNQPTWQQALANARLPLYDVHWTPAVLVQRPGGRKGDAWRVGLADGHVVPLAADGAAQRKLGLYDVVFVHLVEGRDKVPVRAELRVRPAVQGMIVVLENKTGRILAMSGGFSYPLSQLNRATQAVRQPGSAIKPLSHLAALGKGLQPNTLVSDAAITFPPIKKGRARQQDYWTPKNYDGTEGGTLTLRRALENSRNLATAHLLKGGIEDKPEASLERLCQLALEARIYSECLHLYPFVLGAEPVRPVDLAAFYAASPTRDRVRVRSHRLHRAQRRRRLPARPEPGDEDCLGRRGRVLPPQVHDAGRGRARHRARDLRHLTLRRRKDRHLRRCERRRLHQRRDGRGVDRL